LSTILAPTFESKNYNYDKVFLNIFDVKSITIKIQFQNQVPIDSHFQSKIPIVFFENIFGTYFENNDSHFGNFLGKISTFENFGTYFESNDSHFRKIVLKNKHFWKFWNLFWNLRFLFSIFFGKIIIFEKFEIFGTYFEIYSFRMTTWQRWIVYWINILTRYYL